jgi:hypothetical protein
VKLSVPTNEGKMCAVGRCMLPARKRNRRWSTDKLAKHLKRDLDKCQQSIEASSEFWADLQVLHDSSVY